MRKPLLLEKRPTDEPVLYVNGIVSGRGEVSYLNEQSQVSILGVRPDVWSEIVSARLVGGRYLTQGDSFSAVVGDSIAKGLFTDYRHGRGCLSSKKGCSSPASGCIAI